MDASTSNFFIPGRTYQHHLEDGTLSSEGLFAVVYVGTAPEPFEHHSETLGVAFGWRQGVGADGVWEALGSYSSPDFAGWVEGASVGAAQWPSAARADAGSACRASRGGVVMAAVLHVAYTHQAPQSAVANGELLGGAS